ncbi:MAG: NAD(P)/FAD-dependent oxidoreductase [Bacteroidota bacterium]
MDENPKVIIVGAGIAGLVAAIELEKRNIKPVVIESTESVGGRVKTDYMDGFQLDHGFQVLLTAYPEAQHYLDFEQLDLKVFDPGAVINSGGEKMLISDPLRKPGFMMKMIFSGVGSLGDKLKIWQLSNRLKKTTIANIFNKPSSTTLAYLQKTGFSQRVIDNFFKPFFRGIFLEKELETSSRMFEFVFKMFSEGFAAVPAGGMQKIPDQLHSQLKNTEIRFGQSVEAINEGSIVLGNGETETYDSIIITAQPEKMIKGLDGQFSGHRQVTNLYFSIPKTSGAPFIELVPGDDQLVNNICVLDNVSSKYAPANASLLSVSVIDIDEGSTEDELIQRVVNELKPILELPETSFNHLKTYKIYNALPKVDDLQFQMGAGETKVFDGVYLAGDYQLNGSVNSAMTSGRTAAEAVAGYISQNPVN